MSKSEILRSEYEALIQELRDCPLKDHRLFIATLHDVRGAFDAMYFWEYSPLNKESRTGSGFETSDEMVFRNDAEQLIDYDHDNDQPLYKDYR
jgi:hypothetical protein